MKKFEVKNGRWQIGNLYDSLISCKFDCFINLHRKMQYIKLRARTTGNLSKHNYQFNFINRP